MLGNYGVRRIGLGLLVSLLGTFPALAGSLSLEVHETGTGDGTFTKWYTDWGDYDRDFNRQKRLLIWVRDFSRKVQEVTIHVYFIGHPMGRAEPLFVYG